MKQDASRGAGVIAHRKRSMTGHGMAEDSLLALVRRTAQIAGM